MALDFKTPSQVSTEYRQFLKSLKPELNVDQKDSDWWVKGQVVGGVISGAYADQLKIRKDIFPKTARRDALVEFLDTYDLPPPFEAQPAQGEVSVTGDIGTVYAVGNLFQYDPNGNTYQVTEEVTLTAATGTVPALSVNAGQNQNLLPGTILSMPSAPAGHQAAAVLEMADGRNDESTEEIAQRVIDRIQQPIEGGNETDYPQWAREVAGVTSAKLLRYPFGLGTVALYITSGTTDIDQAIDNGEPIIRTPSDALLEEVLEYIRPLKPATDCLSVFGAMEVPQDVTAWVRFANGTGATIPEGQTLTQLEIVEREIKRALYKFPVGGRQFGATGFIVASEIEEALDSRLSASPYQEGSDFQMLLDRQVEDLAVSGANRRILPNEIPVPGTITVVEV